MFQNRNILKKSLISFTIFRVLVFENFNISKSNIICVEATKVYGILQAFDFTSLNKVLHYVNINKGLVIYIKKYLKAKKINYKNSNISPCKNI